MKRIFKYGLVHGRMVFWRKPGKVIHFGLDPNGLKCIWVEAETDKPEIRTELITAPTGGEVPAGVHLGTIVEGQFVWHIYERTLAD